MHKTRSKPYIRGLKYGFQSIFITRNIPENFKISKVTPIDNGDEEMDSFNYRPISSLTRIFEKLVCKLFEQAWNPIRVPIWL